ncbi:DnaJ domain-containing protein [Nocardioides terrisoli]|uniref:DnaJ domain-containing protein n=1 Tax=Nocardioides terrisoli TaxID=3388267 RepID=UPI00287B8AFA|nr:DnaJ domain-containing protein [Nocardioides marmorisolisilvae]
MIQSIDEARAILGVAAESSPATVARAYRRLARATHPDVSSAPDAAERFAAICAAYEVLRQAPIRPAHLSEPETAETGWDADARAPRPDAVPLDPSVAARPSGWPPRGTRGYFGRPAPVIVAGPVTVLPADPSHRRRGRKGDR